VFTILRLIVRGIGAVLDPTPRRAPAPQRYQRLGNGVPTAPPVTIAHPSNVPNGLHCTNDGCHQLNPTTARFCRRCGRALPTPERVGVHRAAMW
jgi:hypothetical protein